MNWLIILEKNDLSKGWIITTLENMGKITTGNTPSKKKSENYGDYLPWVKPPQLDHDSPIIDTPEKLSKLGSKSARILEKDSVLVSCIGNLGKVGYAGTKLATNQQINSVTFYDVIEPKFGFYFFKSLFFSDWLNENKSATIIPIINKGRFLKAPFILCPLNEQKRIVAKIESIFTQIDAAKERLEVLTSQVKSSSGSLSILKNSTLKQAFEGGLVLQDPSDEPAEILLRKIHKDFTKELIFEKENLPKGWIAVKINDVCELIGGGTPSRKKFEYFNGNIIWLTPTEIPKNKIEVINNSKEKITELGLQRSSAKIIPKDSVLLTSRASIGYIAIVDTQVTTNQGFASFICSKIINNYFLAYWLWKSRRLLIENATGTTFKEISKSSIKILEINLPPINEQKRIVSKIESIFGKIDVTEKYVDDTLKSLETLKNSVLKLAFEGKLVDQDPNDEPAATLLEKIKLERIKK